MFPVSSVLLVLTLILSGGYAGLLLMSEIGIIPAVQVLSPHAYADTWRAIDTLMGRRMPPYKISLLLLGLTTAVTLGVEHRTSLAAAVSIAFLFNLADLVFTIRQQFPLNKRIQVATANTSPAELSEILRQTTRNFHLRMLLAASAFVLLAAIAVFGKGH